MFIFQPLQIKSVIAKESLKGYIYVESYKQTHIKQAIEGVGNLRMGMWQQQVRLTNSVSWKTKGKKAHMCIKIYWRVEMK